MIFVFKFACENDDQELLTLLVDRYIKTEKDIYKCILYTINTNRYKITQILIDRFKERIPTIVARDIIIKGQKEIFEILLRENLIETDYVLICRYNAVEILKLLIDGGDFEKENDTCDIYELLVLAIEEQSVDIVDILLNHVHYTILNNDLILTCIKWKYPRIDKVIGLYIKHKQEIKLSNILAYCIEYSTKETFDKVIDLPAVRDTLNLNNLIEALSYRSTTCFIDHIVRRTELLSNKNIQDIFYLSITKHQNYCVVKYIFLHDLIEKNILQNRSKNNYKLYTKIVEKECIWAITLFVDFSVEIHTSYISEIASLLSRLGNIKLLGNFIHRLSSTSIHQCMYQATINNHFPLVKYMITLGHSPNFGVFVNEQENMILSSFDMAADIGRLGYMYTDNLLTLSAMNGFYFISTTLIREGSIDISDLGYRVIKIASYHQNKEDNIFNILLLDKRVRDTFPEWGREIFKTTYYSYVNALAMGRENKIDLLQKRIDLLISLLPRNVGTMGPLEESCGICLERTDYRSVYDFTCNTCRHRFHFLCILGWMINNKETALCGSCPLCRDHINLFETDNFSIGVRALRTDLKDTAHPQDYRQLVEDRTDCCA